MGHTYSPIARCEAEHTMVRINQMQRECAREHGCPAGRICPLGACFANIHAINRYAEARESSLDSAGASA